MNKPHFLESGEPGYLLVSKEVLYVNSCAYAAAVKHLASLVDEDVPSVFRRTAQIADFELRTTSNEEIEAYMQGLVDLKPNSTVFTSNVPATPDESD